jgi:hypothetical protein
MASGLVIPRALVTFLALVISWALVTLSGLVIP